MGLSTSRQVYWKIDYITVDFGTQYMQIRMLGWDSKQDRDDGLPSIMTTNFYFQGETYDEACKDLEEVLKPFGYLKIKTQEKWATASDVVDSGMKEP